MEAIFSNRRFYDEYSVIACGIIGVQSCEYYRMNEPTPYRHVRWILILAIVVSATLSMFQPLPMVRAEASTSTMLLITSGSAQNPFGSYLAEILKTEGFRGFEQIDVSVLTSTDLSGYRVVILAEMNLTAVQATALSTYVNTGGRLLAMRPDAQIANLFGITAVGTTQPNGYLAINSAQPVAQGLPNATLQLHSPATNYTLNGATAVAQLYSTATTVTLYPAIVAANAGSGRTVAFSYDLATNVILTRQGNPANANVDTDGDGVLRTVDLFQPTTQGAETWIDRDKIPLPQADIQQRLFARLIEDLLGVPTPRLWYFPDQAMTMLIVTADAHSNPLSYYQNEINSLAAHNGRATFYLTIGADPSNTDLQAWRAQGHLSAIQYYESSAGLSGLYELV
jgi:hypothetical protein